MSVLNIRSWLDVRALLYVLLPVVTALLVSRGVLTDATAALWSALVTAVLGPVVAAIMTFNLSTARTAFYTVLAAVQALVIGYGIAAPGFLDGWMPLIVAVVGAGAGGVAAVNAAGRRALVDEVARRR